MSSSPLNPDWEGDGRAATFAFGGDVHFPAGTNLGDRLAADPSTALGLTVPQLLSGVNLSMVNLESALTEGTCPAAQPKQYVFYAPPSAISAFQGAGSPSSPTPTTTGRTAVRPASKWHWPPSSRPGTPSSASASAAQAFTPYRTTVNGQRIAIIAATQVIDSGLQTAWAATATEPGLAWPYDVNDLIAAVESARQDSDTVIVYLHWGTELDACPNPLQEPLGHALVEACAGIIVGTHAHVLLGAG